MRRGAGGGGGVRGYTNHYKSTVRSLFCIYMINIVPEVKIVMIDSSYKFNCLNVTFVQCNTLQTVSRFSGVLW